MESHKKLELNQEPNVDYLGHPINGYNLIKHAAMGWKNFHFKINPHLNETITSLDYMQNRANNTGAKYLGFFSICPLKKREKCISFAQLVLLSLYIF